MTLRWLAPTRLPYHRPSVLPLSERLAAAAVAASDREDWPAAAALARKAAAAYDREQRATDPRWRAAADEPAEPEWPGPVWNEDGERWDGVAEHER